MKKMIAILGEVETSKNGEKCSSKCLFLGEKIINGISKEDVEKF